MNDINIVGGKVYLAGELRELDVVVRDGKVEELVAPGTAPKASEELDADGKWVLPGLVDAHFHCRAPAYPEREDFESGSMAAAAGGVTTYFEMPISTPGVYNGKVLNDRKKLAESTSVVDFGLYAAPGTLNPEDIDSAVSAGAIGFKIFLHAAPPERLDEFKGICITDDVELYKALKLVAGTGLVCSVHAEDESMIQAVAEDLGDAAGGGPEAHARQRPSVVEDYASSRLLVLAAHVGTRIHLAHVSSGYAAALLRLARERGVDATGETCPHYVAFDADVMEKYGPFAKVNPPIKGGEDARALREAVRNGDMDILVSDHSPFTVAEKEVGFEDIRKAPSGAPGIEATGRYFLDQVVRENFPMSRVIDALTINPATRFGIADRKGHLFPGADADFILFDPSGETTLKADEMFSRSRDGARVWDGHEFRGEILSTWLRGSCVYRDGEILGNPGYGRMVAPE